jgi:hypothetical protein
MNYLNKIHNIHLFAEAEVTPFDIINICPFNISLLDGFFYIGVQMALPFRKDKKSGVMKSDRELSCAMLIQQHTTCKLETTPDSRKSAANCFKAATLQLGAGGETAE